MKNLGTTHPYFEYFTRHDITAGDIEEGDYFSMFDRVFLVEEKMVISPYPLDVTHHNLKVVLISYSLIDQDRDVPIEAIQRQDMALPVDLDISVYKNPAEVDA